MNTDEASEKLIESFMDHFKVTRETAITLLASLFAAVDGKMKEVRREVEIRPIPHADAAPRRLDIEAALSEIGEYLAARAPDGFKFALLLFDGEGGQMFISNAQAADVTPEMERMAQRLRESHH